MSKLSDAIEAERASVARSIKREADRVRADDLGIGGAAPFGGSVFMPGNRTVKTKPMGGVEVDGEPPPPAPGTHFGGYPGPPVTQASGDRPRGDEPAPSPIVGPKFGGDANALEMVGEANDTIERVRLAQERAEAYDPDHNPPAWVGSEDIWEKAKKAVDPEGKGSQYDNPWAVVAYVYSRMGGETK